MNEREYSEAPPTPSTQPAGPELEAAAAVASREARVPAQEELSAPLDKTPGGPDTRRTGPPMGAEPQLDADTPAPLGTDSPPLGADTPSPLPSQDVVFSTTTPAPVTAPVRQTLPEAGRPVDPMRTTARSAHSPSTPPGQSPGEQPAATEPNFFEAGVAENATMRSLRRPGAPVGQGWDERRVMRLEREVDELRASQKLLEKRLTEASTVAKIALAVGLLATVLAAVLPQL